MDPIAIIEGAKKHGISVLLIFALVWMNNRLSNVEEKLYDCLEDRAQMKATPVHKSSIHKNEPIYAILPKEEKYGKSKRKMEC